MHYPKWLLPVALVAALAAAGVDQAQAQNAPSEEVRTVLVRVESVFRCSDDALDRIENTITVAREEGLDAAGVQNALDEKVEQLTTSGDCTDQNQSSVVRQEVTLASSQQE